SPSSLPKYARGERRKKQRNLTGPRQKGFAPGSSYRRYRSRRSVRKRADLDSGASAALREGHTDHLLFHGRLVLRDNQGTFAHECSCANSAVRGGGRSSPSA